MGSWRFTIYFFCCVTVKTIYFRPTILDKINWNSKPHPPAPNQGWSRAKGKNAPFPHLWFGGKGASRFSIYFVQDCNLGQNKMEQQTPIPPKSRMKLREGQKRAISPSLIWGEGGSRFSIYFVQDCSLNFIRLLRVVITTSVTSESTGC